MERDSHALASDGQICALLCALGRTLTETQINKCKERVKSDVVLCGDRVTAVSRVFVLSSAPLCPSRISPRSCASMGHSTVNSLCLLCVLSPCLQKDLPYFLTSCLCSWVPPSRHKLFQACFVFPLIRKWNWSSLHGIFFVSLLVQ